MNSIQGRKLNVVLIDDKARENEDTIDRLRKVGHAEVYVVDGLESALATLRTIDRKIETIKQIDIILCDVSMEKDTAVSLGDATFTVTSRKLGNFQAKPAFAVHGLEDEGDTYLPFGPILALPFTRFFRQGGVIMPISAYWTKPPLVSVKGKQRPFNGYVYAALALIWGETAGHKPFSISEFGARYSELFERASEEDKPDIEENFYEAVRLRRKQICDDADVLPDVMSVEIRLPDGDEGRATVVDGEFSVIGDEGSFDIVSRASLYADIDYALSNPGFPLTKGYRKQYVEYVQEKRLALQAESKAYNNRLLDIASLHAFCTEFALTYCKPDADESRLVKRYNAVAKKPKYGVSMIGKAAKIPPHIRRYLLLFLQLLLTAKGEKTLSNADMLNCLGLNYDVELGRFVRGGKNDAESDAWKRWMQPFCQLPDKDREGWQEFQFVNLPTGASRRWTEFDRFMAQGFWDHLKREHRDYSNIGELGFSLGAT